MTELLDIISVALVLAGGGICGLLLGLLILLWRGLDETPSWFFTHRFEIGGAYAAASTMFADVGALRMEALLAGMIAQFVGLAAPFAIIPAHPWYHSDGFRHVLVALAIGLAAIVWTIHFVR